LNHIAPVGRGSIVAWTYEAQVMIAVAIGMLGAGFIGQMHFLTFSAAVNSGTKAVNLRDVDIP
jgi:hypothetical protein